MQSAPSDAYETLTSEHYLARLNDSTPWSKTMMPHHRNMVRSQCRVIASYGGGIAGVATLRLSPQPGRCPDSDEALRQVLLSELQPTALEAAGASAGQSSSVFRLAFSMTRDDVAQPSAPR